jgi:DNA-binding transcriptional LysR family regulator
MARLEINRSGEMEVFVEVVRRGGFSAAARTFRMTPSAVSKMMGRLEARLGSRLINRSTRTLQLTPEGGLFFERAVQLLADLDDAERAASANEEPAGRIALSVSASFSTHVLAPVLPAFLDAHPRVSLTLAVTDTVVDLMSERIDVAVRAGPMKSSTLVARKLGATRMMIVAAPSYLARHGVPDTPEDLRRHVQLSFSYARAVSGWPLMVAGKTVLAPARGRVLGNDGEALRRLAVGGAGLTRMALFTVKEDLAAGRLVPVLEHLNPGDLEDFHAVYLGQGGPLPTRIRALLDFLAEQARVG